MASVTAFTADRMLEIENTTVVGGLVDVNGDLLLQPRVGDPINAGHVRGADGIDGEDGAPGLQGPPGETGIPAGTISLWAHETPPLNWLLCDGAAVSRTTYASLFAAIGTRYGAGNGTTTFNVPNLKGRVPVGLDTAQTEFDNLSETGGSKTHTLTIAQVPNVQGRLAIHGSEAGSGFWQPSGAFSGQTSHANLYRPFGAGTSGASSIGTALQFNNGGGGGSHPILQPYQVVNFIIKVTEGETPGDSALTTRVSDLEAQVSPYEWELRDWTTRMQRVLSGGGARKVTSTGISWADRFIVIGTGWLEPSVTGYWSIEQPPDGTVIPVYGHSTVTSLTVAGGYVPINAWYSLYYDVPLDAAHNTDFSRFKIVHYTAELAFKPPPTWILIATHNNDGTGPAITWGDGQHMDYWRGMTLQNAWVAFGTTYLPPAWRYDGYGSIKLRGLVKNGTAHTVNAVFNFGSHNAPENTEIFMTLSNNVGFARIDIRADATMLIYGLYNGATNVYVSFEGVHWDIG